MQLPAVLPVVVIDPGEQAASIPAGIPLSTRATVPVNPFVGVTVTATLVLSAVTTVCDEGSTASTKSGGVTVTVSATFMLCTSVPLVPVKLTKYVPAAVELVDVRVRVELPEPVTVAGAKFAVTPVGNPDALIATTPVKLLSATTLAVYVALLPARMVCELGVADIEKSGVSTSGVTTMVTAPLWLSVPLVPVTVRI